MVQTSQQFTPPQLLEAGHRAESEGKYDLAAQFYRHLTEHYAYTAEAAEARNGLGRIGAVQLQIWHTNGASHPIALSPVHAPEAAGRPTAARVGRRRPVAPRDHYRTGRALAALVSAFGWLLVMVGLLLPAASLLPATGLTLPALPQLLAGAAGSCALGLLVVFCGQVARALFDQANATRELVALERAKFGNE
jgi:hypothetical protein